ncbi:uracil-DNA glycosylase [Parvularcula sp. LCG005]|uniref:uracil-DNA glycosylase n=1 Tax=Parvularcula sp. LCG005 TaxID=3078805 RepID=UPI002942D5CE|nr:uracil-DNA glycosylase [Parvularcula sp. LCG005]WOI54068.1 uracil-DNA glycosylase [Parvularcula sp. LCG005]
MIDPRALLDWYAASGVWSAEDAEPSNFYDWPDRPFRLDPPAPAHEAPAPTAPSIISGDEAGMPIDEAATLARQLAAAAQSIEELDQAIRDFDGCPLKPGARNTVVYDGVPGAPLLIIGEAPGKDEDRVGKPFVGRAGQLLDRMLAAIGTSRAPSEGQDAVCITNSIYWRPPGNRTPTKAEMTVCLPFVERFITLSAPRAIVLTGNVPTGALYPDAPGITRARGQWREWTPTGGHAIPVLPIFHPAFLLRQPAQKRLAWADLLAVKDRMSVH